MAYATLLSGARMFAASVAATNNLPATGETSRRDICVCTRYVISLRTDNITLLPSTSNNSLDWRLRIKQNHLQERLSVGWVHTHVLKTCRRLLQATFLTTFSLWLMLVPFRLNIPLLIHRVLRFAITFSTSGGRCTFAVVARAPKYSPGIPPPTKPHQKDQQRPYSS